MAAMQQIKCVVLGAGAVGKTCLIYTKASGHFPGDYYLSHMDTPAIHISVNNNVFSMSLWDTAGQDDYDRLRPLSYPQTDVFLLCFSVISRWSFEALWNKFYHEIKFHCPATPFMIIGTKCDLRDSKDCKHLDFVSEEEGQELCDEIFGYKYIECSALKDINMDVVFEEGVKAVFDYKASTKYSVFPIPSGLFAKNRKYFSKYGIYDVSSVVFAILCVLLDVILTMMYVLTILNLYLETESWYYFHNVFICGPMVIIAMFNYGFGFIRMKFDDRRYMSPWCAILWIIFYTILVLVGVPLIVFCCTFSIFAYLLYHFIHIKFPFNCNYCANNLFIDLLTMIKHKEYDITLKVIINNALSQKKIISENYKGQLETYISKTKPNKWKEKELRAMMINLEEKDSSFMRYLFYNVYNTILWTDYKKFHKMNDNESDSAFWWNRNGYLFYAVFYCFLFPVFVVFQFSRIGFIFYYHRYHVGLDIIFVLLVLIAMVVFIKFVMQFYWNVWVMGYNRKFRYLSNKFGDYSLPLTAFQRIHQQYEIVKQSATRDLLDDLFGLHISSLICAYLHSNYTY